MKRAALFIGLMLLLATACNLPYGAAPSATPSASDVPPTATLQPQTSTPAEAITPAAPTAGLPLTPDPGLLVKGAVRLPDGSGLAGVKIYLAFASYAGDVVATTVSDGSYQAAFLPIPGDEMVRVWAEHPGYTFEPATPDATWQSGFYYWRHYYGYAERTLDFLAKPDS